MLAAVTCLIDSATQRLQRNTSKLAFVNVANARSNHQNQGIRPVLQKSYVTLKRATVVPSLWPEYEQVFCIHPICMLEAWLENAR